MYAKAIYNNGIAMYLEAILMESILMVDRYI
jgi:hypothetical protein